MITDVWDESNFLIGLESPPFSEFSLLESIKYVWTHQISIYRPLPMSVALLIESFAGPDFLYFRYFNVISLILSISLLSLSLHKYFFLSPSKVAVFYLLSLYSSSVLITGGWFANIFDALALLFISLGVFLMLQKKYRISAVLIGGAFFCKEISILIIPFLGFIAYTKKLKYEELLTPAIIILVLGALYGIIRQSLIPLGSQNDLHGFATEAFLPSFMTFLKSFWWQHTKFSENSLSAWIGLLVFILSIISIKGLVSKAFAGIIVLISALAYWNMFTYQEEVIISSNNFIGRLYLIPSILLLYILSIKANKYIFSAIGLLIFSGVINTYVDHRRFQNLYADIYKLAKEQNKPVFIHYPEKALSDHTRNVFIGHYPDTHLHIDINKAKIIEK